MPTSSLPSLTGDSCTRVATLRKHCASRFLILGVIILLSSCTSRPYSCKSAVYPQTADYPDGDWSLVARVCETRLSPDFFTWQDGVLLSAVIRNVEGETLLEREIFFSGEERLFLDPNWTEASSLVIGASTAQGSGEKVLIAQIYVSLPER